jgi:ribose transport system ATP-binding protein
MRSAGDTYRDGHDSSVFPPESASPKEQLPLLELAGISKHYPGVKALDRVDFSLRSGEVHVLFGENGAGKSTLISIIAGAVPSTEGEVRLRGRKIDNRSVHFARQHGISAVFQEFSLVPTLTVEENLFLGSEPVRGGLIDKATIRKRARQILGRLGFDIRPSQTVQHLSRAQQQMVEIAKAFRSELSVLILDEPTASLTERETDQLFSIIDQIKKQSIGIIYITHRLREIRRVGDRVTVLRDGKYVATVDAKSTSEDRLVQLMTGRVISELFPTIRQSAGRVILEIDDLTTASRSVQNVCIEVRAGEVVGLGGLVGSGKSEVARAVFGLEPVRAGRIVLDGETVTEPSPKAMLDRGFFYSTSDRREEGLMMIRSARENMALAALDRAPFSKWGFLNARGEANEVATLARHMRLYPMKVERVVEQFSGGNQQKIMLAKCLTRAVKLHAFDEPTVGVDVATRVAIYGFIRDLCEAGAAVLLISSDLPEILHLSHRLYVLYRGRIQAELRGKDLTESHALKHFFERGAA